MDASTPRVSTGKGGGVPTPPSGPIRMLVVRVPSLDRNARYVCEGLWYDPRVVLTILLPSHGEELLLVLLVSLGKVNDRICHCL